MGMFSLLEMSPFGLLGMLVAALGLYTFARSIYRAFFHPLAKIPGPKLWAMTDIPYFYYLLRGVWPQKLKTLHDRYGPAVRFTSEEISFITSDAWKEIFGHKNDSTKLYAKDPMFYTQKPGGHPNLIHASDADHKRMRRLVSHAFSEKALRNQETTIKKSIDLFIDSLLVFANDGEAVDMVRWFNFCTFDLVGDLAFGEPFGCMNSQGYHPWISMIFNSVAFAAWAQLLKRYSLESAALALVPKSMIEAMEEHEALTKATVMRRLQSGNTDRADFMSYILRHNDEKGMTEGEIVENSGLFIIAGSETTATLLSGATFRLLQNPKAYNKLVDEIRSAFKSETDINFVSVNGLQYMHAVLDESLRMYPPIPVGTPRVVPAGGSVIEGYYLPEGTSVSVSHLSAYYSEENWTEPQKFVPERFLGEARYANDARSVLNPFSLGPRNCIGRNLAYAEMRLIMARLLWNFDLELKPECANWDEQKIRGFWEKGELLVNLKRVERV
ncbi:Cytochrome P455 monooxygenase [Paramyrothecium foliicola]|nr:Cytochrome P455 monooxygenase [Paramyrothecium foliicola]